MDISSVFKTEVFRPIVITLVPGLMAVVPYLFIVHYYFPNIASLFSKHSSAFIIVVLLVCIAFGQILEDFGSLIETAMWKWVVGSKHDNEIWNEFLRTHFVKEPIGLRYMRTIVLRMKFENSFIAALCFFSAGIFWLGIVGFIGRHAHVLLILAVTFLLILYLAYESYESAKLLKEQRINLLKGVIVK